ncbi:MAG TPA: hypothetical protein VFF72_01110 [Caldimonas sp.]|nr:hypothetical protein [Caldimonas sp.]
MDLPAAPVCPECGFRVFNRRYPKCESCGAILPETLVYSATERHALRVADEERELERARHERPSDSILPPAEEHPLLSAMLDLAE